MFDSVDARAVWQVSAGPISRTYVDQFLRFGVALIGPGDAGPWNSERSDADFDGSFVRRFATDLHSRDILLLRSGRSAIGAIGVVASEYLYLPQFDDVNGWDLQHARRVRWCPLPQPYDFGRPVFGANPPRFSRVSSTEIIQYAESFVRSPPYDWQGRALPTLPTEQPELATPPAELRDIIAQAHDLFPLYWDSAAFGSQPTEDELVSHFVIPFLRALGWPVERLGVKWRNIDVCAFSTLPRSPDTCRFVIESKRLGSGIEGALEQAKQYVSALGLPRDIVVTDGIRYRMYEARSGYAPIAYANLAWLKHSALDLFSRLKRP